MAKSQTKNVLSERLVQAARLVTKCLQKYQESPRRHVLPKAQAVMLERGLSFARDSLQAISEQVNKGRRVQAEILARSFFEVATNLLWASRAKRGWERLQSQTANRDLDWAKKAVKVRGLEEVARQMRQSKQRVARASEAPRLPDVRAMLKQIEKQDIDANLRTVEDELSSDYYYFTVYGLFSDTTHGHMVAIGREPSADWLRHVTAAVVLAALMIIRSVYHSFNWDIDNVMQKAVGILRPSAKEHVQKRNER